MPVHAWLPAALFALTAWAVQRLLSKVALASLGTRKFYLFKGPRRIASVVTPNVTAIRHARPKAGNRSRGTGGRTSR